MRPLEGTKIWRTLKLLPSQLIWMPQMICRPTPARQHGICIIQVQWTLILASALLSNSKIWLSDSHSGCIDRRDCVLCTCRTRAAEMQPCHTCCSRRASEGHQEPHMPHKCLGTLQLLLFQLLGSCPDGRAVVVSCKPSWFQRRLPPVSLPAPAHIFSQACLFSMWNVR